MHRSRFALTVMLSVVLLLVPCAWAQENATITEQYWIPAAPWFRMPPFLSPTLPPAKLDKPSPTTPEFMSSRTWASAISR